MTTKILVLASNPQGTGQLRLVSRRAYKSEFTGELESTVNLLVKRSLLVSNNVNREGQSTVEIAHEALLTSWAELTQ
ncbi:MAG: hypothetical protein ACRC1Z_21580 [Waterburya sp.]